jgi:nucleotide-binding universal stress UspA family protein
MATSASPLFLLPVDGSASSTRAARHCAKLAKALGASVILLNVQPAIEDWQTHGVGRKAAEEHLATLARQAAAEAAKVLGSAGVGFETVIEYGEAHEAIARVADGRKCTSVVMGTRGQGVLRSSLMGSVGMRVLHLVKVPVTFVP